MYALELGGIDPELRAPIRNLVEMLLRLDGGLEAVVCQRGFRRDRGLLDGIPKARRRTILDPWNGWLLRDARLFHGLGGFVPLTPRRIPKLVTVHQIDWLSAREANRLRRAAARADHVVTHSRFVAEQVREQWDIDASRIHSVPLGVDGRRFRALPTDEVVEIHERYGDYVITIGADHPRKNLERLVEAVESIETLRLVLVGPSSPPASRLGERLVHLPRVTDEERLLLLNGASVFAAPSLSEGFGGEVLEAMACGTPVVCSRAGALPEVAEGAAALVDTTDVEALAGALRRVVDDRELAASLRKSGLARAREWTWGRAAERLRALYDELLGAA